MIRRLFFGLIVALLFLSACTPRSEFEDPNLIYTIVASTQTASALQTQMAGASFTQTPTQATLRPTFTPFPTMTSFVLGVTPSPTQTPTPTLTSTPSVLTSWPDWSTGENVTMAKGSGENIGVNRRFSILAGVQVLIVRKNGVKLRSIPNKAQPGPLEEIGGALTLTGIMNKNRDFNWIFAEVLAVDGNTYWVGGSIDEDTDPRNCFVFYYPELTTSPTPSVTETGTPTPLWVFYKTPTPTETPLP